jgi:hypothetical protein
MTPPVLDLGSVETRAEIVIRAINGGWHLRQSKPYGTHLIGPKGDITIIPKDVMEYMITQDLIEFHPTQ